MQIQIKMSIWLHKREWITKRTFSMNKLKSRHLNLKGITSPVVCQINLSNNTLRATYLPKNEDVLLASRFTRHSKGNNHYNSTSNLLNHEIIKTKLLLNSRKINQVDQLIKKGLLDSF